MKHTLEVLPKDQKVEVARSYSQKVNLGNYEMMDVFCSMKAEVPLELAEITARNMVKDCYNQVNADIETIIEERNNKQ